MTLEIRRRHSQGGRPGIHRLPPRAKETLDLMALGLTNEEIAERLTIGIKSVENYINNIYRYLGLEKRGGAARVQAALYNQASRYKNLPLTLELSRTIEQLHLCRADLKHAEEEYNRALTTWEEAMGVDDHEQTNGPAFNHLSPGVDGLRAG